MKRIITPQGMISLVLALGVGCASAPCSTQKTSPNGLANSSSTHTSTMSTTGSGVASSSTNSSAPNVPGEDDSSGSVLGAKLATLRKNGKTGDFRPPNTSEDTTFRQWFSQVVAKLDSGEPMPAAPSGFTIESISQMPGVWVIGEDPSAKRGAGAFVLRAKPKNDVIVEAPHTFYDLGTLDIARAIFEKKQCRALVINTVHRYRGKDVKGDDDDGGSPSDVAHVEHSFFQIAHEELSRTFAHSPVVQIHGFADSKAPGAAIVSASGTNGPASGVARSLKQSSVLPTVLLYPDDVKVLGGMTNMQARWSAKNGRGFVHIELSASTRERLRRESAFSDSFADALLAGATSPKP